MLLYKEEKAEGEEPTGLKPLSERNVSRDLISNTNYCVLFSTVQNGVEGKTYSLKIIKKNYIYGNTKHKGTVSFSTQT